MAKPFNPPRPIRADEAIDLEFRQLIYQRQQRIKFLQDMRRELTRLVRDKRLLGSSTLFQVLLELRKDTEDLHPEVVNLKKSQSGK